MSSPTSTRLPRKNWNFGFHAEDSNLNIQRPRQNCYQGQKTNFLQNIIQWSSYHVSTLNIIPKLNLLHVYVLTYRVRKNLTDVHELVDPDPAKCYTKKKISKCPACCIKPEASINEEASTADQQWMNSTTILSKQFSFCNIQTYVQKSAKEGKTTEKPIRKGYKLFFENYVFDIVGLKVSSGCHIKVKCYRSQKKSQVPHDMTVTLSNNGDNY